MFVDTSALVALINEEDSYHSQAIELFTKCHENNSYLVTSHYIVSEFITMMRCSYKKPIEKIVTFIRNIQVSEIEIFGISKEVFDDAINFLLKYEDHYFSVTDCISFIVMKELKTKDVLTTDKHFTIAGFNCLF